MKRWIAVLALAVMVPVCGAQTVDTAKQAKVQALFDVMHMDKMMDKMMTSVMQMVGQMVQSTPGVDQMSPAQQKLLAGLEKNAMKLATDNMGWKAMEPEYVKIYADTFSSDEIDAITKFYSSPAGQTMLEKTPELTQASMKIVQARMVTLQPQLKALQDQFVKDMANAEPPAGKKTSPPSH